MAEFTKEFNVEMGSRAYRDLIKDLRVRLGNTFSHNIRVLVTQQNPPTQWFNIILRTNNHWIKLRIRQDNLYLDGYQMENFEWLEFGRTFSTSPHLIPGSTFLGYDGSYSALKYVSKQGMNNITLGPIALTNAINDLAISATSSADRARSLIIVIQMICESIRFTRISDFLADTFCSNSSLPPPDWILALVRGWGDLSAALLRADADPNNFFRLPQPNDMNIVSAADAVAVLGILLKSVRA